MGKKVARVLRKPKAPKFPTLMERTIAAQQAVRARNDWRSQIRDADTRAKAFLTQHMKAQPNRFY